MNTLFWRAVCLISFLIGCTSYNSKYSSQLKIVDSFLNFISIDDTSSIRKFLFVKDLKSIAKEGNVFNFYVNKGYKIIKKNGIPNHDKYILKKYPSNSFSLLDVTIPFSKGNFNQTDSYIRIRFIRNLPEMVSDFEVREGYDTTEVIKSIDTTLKKKQDTVRLMKIK